MGQGPSSENCSTQGEVVGLEEIAGGGRGEEHLCEAEVHRARSALGRERSLGGAEKQAHWGGAEEQAALGRAGSRRRSWMVTGGGTRLGPGPLRCS